jgi:hypothetical protein
LKHDTGLPWNDKTATLKVVLLLSYTYTHLFIVLMIVGSRS